MQHEKVAVVTGSSSGIGFETSLLFARNGFYTYATMRNVDKSNKITDLAKRDNLPLEVSQLDVSNDESVKDAVNIIAEKRGRIDVVVNNAGYGSTGAVEDFSMEEIKAQFETNFFGSVRVIQSVLPLMRRQREGTIVNVISIGGRIAFPFSPFYASTKFAMEGLSEALRYEVAQFGIRVILVEPGLVKTNFFENVKKPKKAEDSDSPYHQLVQRRINRVKGMLENGTTAEEVAKVIYRAATSSKEEHNLRYMIGSDAESVMEKRKKMIDREFFDFMSKNILDTTYN